MTNECKYNGNGIDIVTTPVANHEPVALALLRRPKQSHALRHLVIWSKRRVQIYIVVVTRTSVDSVVGPPRSGTNELKVDRISKALAETHKRNVFARRRFLVEYCVIELHSLIQLSGQLSKYLELPIVLFSLNLRHLLENLLCGT